MLCILKFNRKYLSISGQSATLLPSPRQNEKQTSAAGFVDDTTYENRFFFFMFVFYLF